MTVTRPDLLMLSAVDRIHGNRHPHVVSVILDGACIRRLLGLGAVDRAVGATAEPTAVLQTLDGYRPHDHRARADYAAVLKLALVAEAFGVLLTCSDGDPTVWSPQDHPDYWNSETQQALGFITVQLGCTVEQATHRLFAHLDETGTSLAGTTQDVVAHRLVFLGTHDAAGVAPGRPGAG